MHLTSHVLGGKRAIAIGSPPTNAAVVGGGEGFALVQQQEKPSMRLYERCFAEFFGTFWLVLGGCGSAVLSAAYPQLGIGFLGVAFAFGLTVLTMAYAVGHVSGGHFNPAVSVGLLFGGRFKNAL